MKLDFHLRSHLSQHPTAKMSTIESVVRQKAHRRMSPLRTVNQTRGAGASHKNCTTLTLLRYICFPESMQGSCARTSSGTNASIHNLAGLVILFHSRVFSSHRLAGIRLVIPRDGTCGHEQSLIPSFSLRLIPSTQKRWTWGLYPVGIASGIGSRNHRGICGRLGAISLNT